MSVVPGFTIVEVLPREVVLQLQALERSHSNTLCQVMAGVNPKAHPLLSLMVRGLHMLNGKLQGLIDAYLCAEDPLALFKQFVTEFLAWLTNGAIATFAKYAAVAPDTAAGAAVVQHLRAYVQFVNNAGKLCRHPYILLKLSEVKQTLVTTVDAHAAAQQVRRMNAIKFDNIRPFGAPLSVHDRVLLYFSISNIVHRLGTARVWMDDRGAEVPVELLCLNLHLLLLPGYNALAVVLARGTRQLVYPPFRVNEVLVHMGDTITLTLVNYAQLLPAHTAQLVLGGDRDTLELWHARLAAIFPLRNLPQLVTLALVLLLALGLGLGINYVTHPQEELPRLAKAPLFRELYDTPLPPRGLELLPTVLLDLLLMPVPRAPCKRDEFTPQLAVSLVDSIVTLAIGLKGKGDEVRVDSVARDSEAYRASEGHRTDNQAYREGYRTKHDARLEANGTSHGYPTKHDLAKATGLKEPAFMKPRQGSAGSVSLGSSTPPATANGSTQSLPAPKPAGKLFSLPSGSQVDILNFGALYTPSFAAPSPKPRRKSLFLLFKNPLKPQLDTELLAAHNGLCLTLGSARTATTATTATLGPAFTAIDLPALLMLLLTHKHLERVFHTPVQPMTVAHQEGSQWVVDYDGDSRAQIVVNTPMKQGWLVVETPSRKVVAVHDVDVALVARALPQQILLHAAHLVLGARQLLRLLGAVEPLYNHLADTLAGFSLAKDVSLGLLLTATSASPPPALKLLTLTLILTYGLLLGVGLGFQKKLRLPQVHEPPCILAADNALVLGNPLNDRNLVLSLMKIRMLRQGHGYLRVADPTLWQVMGMYELTMYLILDVRGADYHQLMLRLLDGDARKDNNWVIALGDKKYTLEPIGRAGLLVKCLEAEIYMLECKGRKEFSKMYSLL